MVPPVSKLAACHDDQATAEGDRVAPSLAEDAVRVALEEVSLLVQ